MKLLKLEENLMQFKRLISRKDKDGYLIYQQNGNRNNTWCPSLINWKIENPQKFDQKNLQD
jgi:hypothetical protein